VEGNKMTRAIQVTFIAAAILGLGCGGYLGRRNAVEVSDSLESIQYTGPSKVASDFARTQFMRADADHARQAVMLQIQLLEQLEQADKTFREDGILWLAYTRLAMIEEAAGRPDAEHSALANAKALYDRDYPRGQRPTYDELKNAVLELDRAADNLKP
jgi:hypothetical protein